MEIIQPQINAPTQPRALIFLAKVVSYVFHPVLMPLVMAYVIYMLMPATFATLSDKQTGLWFMSIGVTAVFFPIFSILLLKPLGFIESFHFDTAKERTIPLMIAMIFYFWVSHVFNNVPNSPFLLRVLLLGNFWSIIVIFIINIFTKISLHTTAAGGMLGIIFIMTAITPVNMDIPLMIAILISGIIGTARLILGAHQRGDVWLGYILGIITQVAAFIYLK